MLSNKGAQEAKHQTYHTTKWAQEAQHQVCHILSKTGHKQQCTKSILLYQNKLGTRAKHQIYHMWWNKLGRRSKAQEAKHRLFIAFCRCLFRLLVSFVGDSKWMAVDSKWGGIWKLKISSRRCVWSCIAVLCRFPWQCVGKCVCVCADSNTCMRSVKRSQLPLRSAPPHSVGASPCQQASRVGAALALASRTLCRCWYSGLL